MLAVEDTLKLFCVWSWQQVPEMVLRFRQIQAWHERKTAAINALQKRKRGLEKKLGLNQQSWLTASKNISLFQDYATLLQAYFKEVDPKKGQIVLNNFDEAQTPLTIALDPLKTTAQNIADYYKKSKKAQKSLPHLHSLIALTKTNLIKADSELTALHQLDLFAPIPNFDEGQKKASSAPHIVKKETRQPYREFISRDGLIIRVGKSAKDNDALTFSLSAGLDFWFHVMNSSGSHVVAKAPKNQPLPEKTLQDAAQLALHFSSLAEKKEADVCFTQIKHLKRVKGKAGAVQLAGAKQRRIRADAEILQRLFADNRQPE